CCIPDPQIPESEEVLIARAKELHPEQTFPGDFPSRFKKEGAGAPAAAPTAAAAPATSPQPAAPAPPPQVSAPAPATPTSLGIPEIDEWEVPIDCFNCHGVYAVAFKHFRSGVVFYCPFCQTSYVVTTSMYGHVSRALRGFHAQWQKDFDAFQ